MSANHSTGGAQEAIALHGIFFLTGMGMMLLGPVLPSLSATWNLQDAHAGMLLGALFLGSFLGAATLRQQLRRCLIEGCGAAVLGFAGAALAATVRAGFLAGGLAFLLGGFGLGRAITSINLIAGEKFRGSRASALSMLSFTWGVGALLAPVVAGLTISRLRASGLLGIFAITTAVVGWIAIGYIPRERAQQADPTLCKPELAGLRQITSIGLVYFATMFFLYGGLESSISGWLSTYTLRTPGGTLRSGAMVTSSLWLGLTVGRAVAAALLLRLSERVLLVVGLVLAAGGTILLVWPVPGAPDLPWLAGAIGIGLAPAFPGLSAMLLARTPKAREAGSVMAISAFGGAVFPWLVGILSQRSGSLNKALAVPSGLCVVLILLVIGYSDRWRRDRSPTYSGAFSVRDATE
jgi:FHS family glucose/mannose:H+ symporter-like MFS transporter